MRHNISKKFIRFFILYIGFILPLSTVGKEQIDSLKNQLLFCDDSIKKADILYELARELSKNNETLTLSQYYLDSFFKLSTSIKYYDGLVYYYDFIGHNYRNKGQYSLALMNHLTAKEIAESNKLFKNLPRIYNNIGVVYRRVDDYSNGLKYHLKALTIAEANNDSETKGYALNSIGNIYTLTKQYNKALDYFNIALVNAESTQNKRSKAINLNNIGEVHEYLQDFEQALNYYNESLDINLEIDNTKGIGISYDCIGNIYRKTDRFEKALEYYIIAAKFHEKHQESLFYSISLKNIGAIYFKLNKTNESEMYLNDALQIARSISSKTTILEVYKLFSDLEKKKGNYKKAYEYVLLSTAYADSVWNEQNSLNVAKLQAIYDTDKQQDAISKLKIEKQLDEKLIERKNTINLALTIITILVIVSILFLYRGYIIIQKRNDKLKQQAQVIVQKNNSLEQQKIKIEQVNNRITDSLNYAQKIQQALLPTYEKISSLFQEYFIIYKPLDVVSGDFYWVYCNKEKLLFATADCTGHGVPGALMSMLGISHLNELAQHNELNTPAEYLNKLRQLIINSLNQRGDARELKDGLSISLCLYDRNNKTLQFSGAQSTIIVLRHYSKEKQYSIDEYKGDKMPVGYFLKMTPFTNHIIEPDNLDTIYLYSDGFIDQFGGNEKKRFKKQNLFALILKNSNKSLYNQKTIFNDVFDEWKGDLEQIDDVLLMGVKLKNIQ